MKKRTKITAAMSGQYWGDVVVRCKRAVNVAARLFRAKNAFPLNNYWVCCMLDDDPDVCGDPIPCESCGATIPSERLEVFPESKVCARCQAKFDRGEQAGPLEYCPRLPCGTRRPVRRARGSDVRVRRRWSREGPQPLPARRAGVGADGLDDRSKRRGECARPVSV